MNGLGGMAWVGWVGETGPGGVQAWVERRGRRGGCQGGSRADKHCGPEGEAGKAVQQGRHASFLFSQIFSIPFASALLRPPSSPTLPTPHSQLFSHFQNGRGCGCSGRASRDGMGWDGGDKTCLSSPEDALSEFRVRHQNEHSLGLHRRTVGLLPRLLQPLTSLSPLLHPCLPQRVEGRRSGFRKGLEGEGRPGGEGIRGGEKERTWRERYVCVENVKIRLHVSMCFVLSFKHYFLKLGIRQGR